MKDACPTRPLLPRCTCIVSTAHVSTSCYTNGRLVGLTWLWHGLSSYLKSAEASRSYLAITWNLLPLKVSRSYMTLTWAVLLLEMNSSNIGSIMSCPYNPNIEAVGLNWPQQELLSYLKTSRSDMALKHSVPLLKVCLSNMAPDLGFPPPW